jgi:hypothetical protein
MITAVRSVPEMTVCEESRPFAVHRNICNFCVVWLRLRAKVLGRLGRRPHPRVSTLSCPSLDIYGPGSSAGPGLYNALGRALVFPLLPGAALFVAAYTDNRELQFFASPRSYAAGRFLCTPRPR